MSYRPARFQKMLTDFDWRDGSLFIGGGGGGQGRIARKNERLSARTSLSGLSRANKNGT